MYLHHDARLCYLAHPKTASVATAMALSEVGFRNIDGKPCTGSAHPHHMTVERSGFDLDGWTVFTTVRNHWDAVVSWMCQGDGMPCTASELQARLDRHPWFEETTMWQCHLPDADAVLKYETLGEDLNTLISAHGLDWVDLPVTPGTPGRMMGDARRPYGVFYNIGTREYVGERFADEIRALGYSYEERP